MSELKGQKRVFRVAPGEDGARSDRLVQVPWGISRKQARQVVGWGRVRGARGAGTRAGSDVGGRAGQGRKLGAGGPVAVVLDDAVAAGGAGGTRRNRVGVWGRKDA